MSEHVPETPTASFTNNVSRRPSNAFFGFSIKLVSNPNFLYSFRNSSAANYFSFGVSATCRVTFSSRSSRALRNLFRRSGRFNGSVAAGLAHDITPSKRGREVGIRIVDGRAANSELIRDGVCIDVSGMHAE